MHKVSTKTKLVNTIAILIGTSPLIAAAKSRLLEQQNPQAFGEDVAWMYSAGLSKGSFNWQAALDAYGPVVGAIFFKKAMKHLKGKTLIG